MTKRRPPARHAASENRPEPTSRAISNSPTSGSTALLSPRFLIACLILVSACIVVFAQVRHFGFLMWDDPDYITANAHVAQGLTLPGVLWALTSNAAANWHPVTWLSHMLDVQLYGMNAGPQHVTNLVIHILDALLLFGLLCWMTKALGRSLFVALLFAVHPLHVESVAWLSERKDVLSTFFLLLTICAYAAYVRRRSAPRYALVVLMFALGLMAKPMLVTTPFLLLLLDFWPLRRIESGTGPLGLAALKRRWPELRPLLTEKLPLFALSAASSVMTIVAQHHGNALAGLERAPLSHRLLNAAASYLGYIVNTLWPVRLAAFYPVPASSRFLTAAAGLLVLAAVTIFVFRAGQRHGFLLTGWLWYVGALIPVIGLVQVGEQAMADRYTYVPLAGLFLIAAWGVPELVGKWRYGRVVLPVLAVCAGTACVAVARAQVQYWSGNIPLWQHTLDVTGDNPLAQTHLGTALLKQGKADEAIPHLAEALRLLPQLAWAQYNMGSALLQQGKADEATPYFLEALRLKPHDADAHFNLGSALTRQQRFTEAIAEYAEALRLQPDHPEAHNNLGGLLLRLGRTAEAIPHITEALRLKPDYAEAHNNLGGAYLNQGSIAEAIPHFTEALRIKPDFALAQNNLGIALMQQGRRDEAAQHFAEAVRIEPGYDEARENLSIALGQQEQAGGAAAPDLNALALPRDAETLNDLGVMLARQGNMEEAAKKFAEALRINPGFTMASNNLKRALARLGRNSRNSGFVP